MYVYIYIVWMCVCAYIYIYIYIYMHPNIYHISWIVMYESSPVKFELWCVSFSEHNVQFSIHTFFFWTCLHICILIFKYFTNICCVLKLNMYVIVLKLRNLDLGPCLFSSIENIFECWLIRWMFFKACLFF